MKNFRYGLVSCLLLFFGFSISAQDLEQKISDGTCDCLSKKDVSGMDMDAFTMEMGLCMVTLLVSEDAETLEKNNVNITDEVSMGAFGERVGMKLSMECPTFLTKIMELMSEEDSELVESIKEQKGGGATKEFGSMTGTFSEVTSDQMATIVIKDEKGKSSIFYWIKPFEGSEQFMGNEAKKMKNKKLEISFVEYEAYVPKAEAYYKIKEIKSIDVLN